VARRRPGGRLDFARLFRRRRAGVQAGPASGRSVYGRRADGSVAWSNVVRAYREYLQRGEFNRDYSE
jgi:hypothetical protein